MIELLRNAAGVLVFITSGEYHLVERLSFASYAPRLLAGCHHALITVSGPTLEDALAGLPDDTVRMVVVSPHTPDREKVLSDVRRRWPAPMSSFDEDAAGPEKYVVLDLRAL